MNIPRPASFRLIALAAASLLAACAATTPPQVAPAGMPAGAAAAPAPGTAADPSAGYGLTGTRWQLVEIQGEDNQSPARPANPSRYTVQFGAEGRVSFQLDCNKGQGMWRVQPMGDGHTGPLQFTGLQLTEATCGPSPLGPRVAAALPQVRGYLVRNGQLFMSLAADAGLLTWAPAP